MVVEAPIDISAAVAPLFRFGVLRMMPHCLRKLRPFSTVGLWASARLLRQHFDQTDAKYDRHVHWLAIEGASSILGRLDILYPEKKVGPHVWREFLALIVAAAEDGSIDRARAAIDVIRPEEEEVDEQSDILSVDDSEAVRINPANGWRVARLIMKAATVDEVAELFEDFRGLPQRTSDGDVFAARALKMSRLLNKDDQDDDWWWDFYEEANRLEISDEQALASLTRLEKEFPVE